MRFPPVSAGFRPSSLIIYPAKEAPLPSFVLALTLFFSVPGVLAPWRGLVHSPAVEETVRPQPTARAGESTSFS